MADRAKIERLAKELSEVVRTNDWVALSRLLSAAVATIRVAATNWRGTSSVPPANPAEGDMFFNTHPSVNWVQVYVASEGGWITIGEVPA